MSSELDPYLNTIESVTKTMQCGKYKDAEICSVVHSVEAYSGFSTGFVWNNWRTHDSVIGKEMPKCLMYTMNVFVKSLFYLYVGKRLHYVCWRLFQNNFFLQFWNIIGSEWSFYIKNLPVHHVKCRKRAWHRQNPIKEEHFIYLFPLMILEWMNFLSVLWIYIHDQTIINQFTPLVNLIS